MYVELFVLNNWRKQIIITSVHYRKMWNMQSDSHTPVTLVGELCLGKAVLDRRVTLDFAGKAAKILQGL